MVDTPRRYRPPLAKPTHMVRIGRNAGHFPPDWVVTFPRNQWSFSAGLLIMDGELGPYDDLEPRLRRADTVVVLDMPLWLSVWRALRCGRERGDFWRWVLRWRRESRPKLMTAIARHAPDADVVVLRGRRAVKRWLTAA